MASKASKGLKWVDKEGQQVQSLRCIETMLYTYINVLRGPQTITRSPIVSCRDRSGSAPSIVKSPPSRHPNVNTTGWGWNCCSRLVANQPSKPIRSAPQDSTTSGVWRSRPLFPFQHPPRIPANETSNCNCCT